MTSHAVRSLMLHEHAALEVVPFTLRHSAGGAAIQGLPARGSKGSGAGQRWLLRRESLQRRLLALGDVVAANLSALVVLIGLHSATAPLRLLLSIPIVLLLFKVTGLYDGDQLRLVHSTLDEAPRLAQVTGLYALWTAIASPLLFGHDLAAHRIAALWVASFALTFGIRSMTRWLGGMVAPSERCLVIGDLDLAERIRAKIESSHARACVVATLKISEDEVDHWSAPDLRRLVSELRLDRVIVAPRAANARGVTELVRLAQAAGVRVSILPRLLEVVGSAVEFDHVDGMTMVGVRPFGLSRSSRVLKRALDLVVGLVGMICLAPVLAMIAVAIRLESKGPVLFRQVRVGRQGREFQIFKFRSMVADAEERQPELRAANALDDALFKMTSDPRVTRVGDLLRRTSLDELPQLFNVLRGEMSLVGPRPLVVDEDQLVRGLDRRRLQLTPGMTGPWQILGARAPMGEMVALDYLYVANWSLWSDLKILLRTVRHVVRRGNV